MCPCVITRCAFLTGYERDIETDLDFAQARYYNKNFGRFTSTDPLYLDLNRLIDPQQLNLYSYSINNPIKFTDSTGLSIELSCDSKENCATATQNFNKRKGKQFEVSLGKDGKLQVEGNVDLKKLSKAETALYNAITDKKNNATINVVGDTGRQEFGVHVGKGENTVDIQNLSKLDSPSNNGGLNSGDALAHEALDAYYSLSMDADTADIEAAKLYPGLYEPEQKNIQELWNTPRTRLLGMRLMQGITDGRGSMQITVKFNTPIPAIELDSKVNSKEKIQQTLKSAPARVLEVNFFNGKIPTLNVPR